MNREIAIPGKTFSITILLAIFSLLCINLNATTDTTSVYNYAYEFLSKKLGKGSLKSGIATDLKLVYESSDTSASKVFIYKNLPGGYVLVLKSQENLIVPAYSLHGDFNFEMTGTAFQELIKSFENANSVVTAPTSSHAGSLAPLLDKEGINFNQSSPYNDACPYDADAGVKAYAGCVAISMAQVMRYHKHPATGQGSNSYDHPKYGTLSANFGATTYNWVNIPGTATSANADLAKLIYHAGISVNMNYSAQLPGSAAPLNNIAPALVNYFKYPNTSYIYEDDFIYNYEVIIRNELDNNRPIIYHLPGTPGHTVVVDGYDGDYFHMNFGWGGSENGYFYLGGVNFAGSYQFGFRGDCILGISPTYIKANQQDSLALVTLFNSTGGNNWYRKTNWLTGKLNSWEGVSVVSGRVVGLNLLNNNLTGDLPSQLNNLTLLSNIRLGGNKLTGNISCFGNLPNLMYLDLSSNNFKGNIPVEIGTSSNLLTLRLGFNKFSGSIPKELGNLTKLMYLSIDNDSLTGTVPAEICNLKSLLSLELMNNYLTGSLPEYLGNLTSLQTFNISGNKFSGMIPASVTGLKNLYTFGINNNQFEGVLPAGIGQFTNLIQFDISNNKFTAIPKEIGLLTNVTSINAENNLLKDSIPSSVSQLINLKSINLRKNQITSIPASIGSLKNLTTLYLENNKIKKLPVSIGNLSSLEELKLSYNELETLPFEVGLLNKLTWLVLDYNQLTSLTFGVSFCPNLLMLDVSHNKLSSNLPELKHLKLYNCKVSYNNLSFENIAASKQPNNEEYFYYRNQGQVKLNKNLVEYTLNDSVGVDIRKISLASHPNNQYTWYKNVQQIATGPVISYKTATSLNQGSYYCKIDNSVYNAISLNTDTIVFRMIDKSSLKTDTLISNKVYTQQFFNDTVTLVSPKDTRGTLTWQASLDSVTWYNIAATGNDPKIGTSIFNASAGKVVLTPKANIAYRYKLTEGTCQPVYSDTVLVAGSKTKLLLDTVLNVTDSMDRIKLKNIHIEIPKNFYHANFRLTIAEIGNPPAAPDSLTLGPVYDVKVSCGTQFDIPITIKIKVKSDSLVAEKIKRFQAVYFDEKAFKWISYPESSISMTDSFIVFQTNHLTKLSWWWNEDNFLEGFDYRFMKNGITVYYKEGGLYIMELYNKEQTSKPWHLKPGDPQYGTPLFVQDALQYIDTARTTFKNMGLKTPYKFAAYIDFQDDFGNVGFMGMLNGYLTLSVVIDNKDTLQSVTAHEFKHYVQSSYFTPHGGNTFWAEATAHLADRMVWNEASKPISESDVYLLDSREKPNSIFKSLSTSWDYWDANFIGQKSSGNLDLCYLAGCFIHYMRSYRPGTKLQPEVLLKETSLTGSWKDYLDGYITKYLQSTIGSEFENYVKYIFEGKRPSFSVLNVGPNAEGEPLKYIMQAPEEFSVKHLYKFPEEQTVVPVEKEEIIYNMSYLSARMEQFFNLSLNRSICVKYKRMHTDTANTRVYLCTFNTKTQTMDMVNISKVDSSYFFIKAATDENVDAKAHKAFLLFINKSNNKAVDVKYKLQIMPVADFDHLFVQGFISGSTMDPAIHNFSDGQKRPIIISFSEENFTKTKVYTDSSFVTTCIAGGTKQEVYYNFLNGKMVVTETSSGEQDVSGNPDGCIHFSTYEKTVLTLKDIFLVPLDKNSVAQGAGIYKFITSNTTDTKAKLVSISLQNIFECTKEGGAKTTQEYNYTGTDWNSSDNIKLLLQFM